MSQQFTIEDLKTILQSCLDVPDGSVLDDPDTLLQDLSVDSAALLAVQMELETAYGIQIGDDDVMKMQTVGQTVDHVNHLMQAL